jgi:DMSO/TMAO reductase YedYZ molybdopterin-dependent catalytic subunit
MKRRGFLIGSALALSGCKVLDGVGRQGSGLHRVFASANGLTYRVQRGLAGQRLAPEYAEADLRQSQHPNGVTAPADEDYGALAADGFAGYRLAVTGLVDAPLSLSLDTLRAMPARTQITRHDCVEGWSCIAKWTGTPLGAVLDLAKPKLTARYAVFHCFDTIERSLSGAVKYYESIDLIDAWHPQTILACGLNGSALPVANGAPVRVRVERALGYKMAKYVHTIELTDSLAGFGAGYGSYWADRGYDWYAGI